VREILYNETSLNVELIKINSKRDLSGMGYDQDEISMQNKLGFSVGALSAKAHKRLKSTNVLKGVSHKTRFWDETDGAFERRDTIKKLKTIDIMAQKEIKDFAQYK
jgi:hypothetical protein